MKTKYLILLFIFLTTHLSSVFAQNENNYWYFGNNSGLDFSSGTAVPINGSLNTYEGCASISTSTGNLLFYTDGTTVYNKLGSVMVNGSGLLGNSSSTSSAIIVPLPCSSTEYVIFTVDFIGGSNGINYSLIDMDDDNDGIYEPATEHGRVIAGTKNINLPGPTGESICAVKKDNGLDFWIITRNTNTNTHYVYELSNMGVLPAPSPYDIQLLGDNLFPLGYLKANTQGTKLAQANGLSKNVIVYDFDNSNGAITNSQIVGNVPRVAYGVEFSTDGTELFYSDIGFGNGTGNGYIYKVQILPTVGTQVLIATVPNQGGYYSLGALQINPKDSNKILVAMPNELFLGEIDISTSVFNRTAVPLINSCYLGLPTFVSGQINTACLNLEPYANAVPTLFPITVKTEIATSSLTGDKEFGDFDNDGDIDILYTKVDTNNNIYLYVLINNAGVGNPPAYSALGVNLTFLGISSVEYSARFVDWNLDGWNDIIVHGPNGGTYLYINDQNGSVNNGLMMLNGGYDYPSIPYSSPQFIAVGDLNNDGFPDLLISHQPNNVVNSWFGTVYFENNQSNTYPYFDLVSPQNFINGMIDSPFILDNNGSIQIPEIYDADCDGDNDIFISDPLTGPPNWDGGRMYYHENNGVLTTGTLPDINTTGIDNQFGFVDIPGNDMGCDRIITRLVDYFNNGCPIAISYNPCSDEFYYYDQECSCGSLLSVSDFNNEINNKEIILYPNPTDSRFSIEKSSSSNIDSVVIYSITGIEIKRMKYNGTAIDVSQFPKGIYFVKITSEGKSITKKLIKN